MCQPVYVNYLLYGLATERTPLTRTKLPNGKIDNIERTHRAYNIHNERQCKVRLYSRLKKY